MTVRLADGCPCADPCPCDSMTRHIGGKWKTKVLCTLYCGKVLRYSELKRLVKGVSPTMLAATLRELEESGLVKRTIYDTMPVKVDYRLTEAGLSLVPILGQLRAWALAYEPDLYREV